MIFHKEKKKLFISIIIEISFNLLLMNIKKAIINNFILVKIKNNIK